MPLQPRAPPPRLPLHLSFSHRSRETRPAIGGPPATSHSALSWSSIGPTFLLSLKASLLRKALMPVVNIPSPLS